jgi:hypothetical protein
MSDQFEEWDFRTRERIHNLPDIEDGDYMEKFTKSDIIFLFIIVVGFFSFWGGLVWLLK